MQSHEAPSGDASASAAQVMLDLSVAAAVDGPMAARTAVAAAIAGRVDDVVVADAQLVVSELVTNSVLHGGLAADELVHVGAALVGGMLRLEVGNPRTAGTIAVHEPDLVRGGGLGLGVVGSLAYAWGVTRDADTQVWVELACPPAAA